ncbi:hypothetical protein E2K99_02790 [Herbaspirillum huttiense]|uniref:lysylphosphatidylglycerol synthase domain-containing protein n=1 Tax=Herbaspirillum huttiense TaxID=863372 RepID=UPI001065977E|nr:hypothetical protein [Herbaspirillum huttiense]QBP74005.1 hypothetical protein E2K99_02790 [Herbaspirillum huttiense]
MSTGLRIYLVFLFGVVAGWLWWRGEALMMGSPFMHLAGLLCVVGLYIFSHLLRMMRLFLLTLDERSKAAHLISAHALTAFPSSFLPFKLGEVLRLCAFLRIYEFKRKGLAIWLAERFGDVLVISVFIVGLYVFNVKVPPAMQVVFFVFLFVGAFGLLATFALTNVFIYLNRHLVLTSLSSRGLLFLRASHSLQRLADSIRRSLEGRVSGFLLLSVLIWVLEILALSLFINWSGIGGTDFALLFSSGLLASLPGGGTGAFGIYQSLALVVMTITFACGWIAVRLNKRKN